MKENEREIENLRKKDEIISFLINKKKNKLAVIFIFVNYTYLFLNYT